MQIRLEYMHVCLDCIYLSEIVYIEIYALVTLVQNTVSDLGFCQC